MSVPCVGTSHIFVSIVISNYLIIRGKISFIETLTNYYLFLISQTKNIELILGPLFSSSTKAIVNIAKEKQIIGIEFPQKSDHWVLRDNGSGSLIKTWDHLIFLESEGGGTRYTDEVSIDAGLLTLPIYIYAFIFYSYRQMRWRKLVNLNFRPLNDQLIE